MQGPRCTIGSAASGTAVCQFFVFAISVAVLCINRYQINGIFSSYSWPYARRSVACAYSATGKTPCNYLYAVGGFGLLFSILIGLLQLAVGKRHGVGVHIGNVVLNVMNVGWWIAAGVYFTTLYDDLPKPAGFVLNINTNIPYDYMRAINALCFTAVAFAALSLIASFAGLTAARKAQKEDQDLYRSEKPSPQRARVHNPPHRV
mmetsp:Transcript_29282/g.86648  ORF Transcript_29282/g.86648 Transcript_29282/m.86648 type:complete len:204 (-) Transcript_29282:270-881(-)